MRLIQIPFSHNCVKVRRALELKGLPFETLDIAPMEREAVRRASGQSLVPVLVDGSRTISDSTEILLHLEAAYPEPALLPSEAAARTECLLLEDWADAAFMALTRRLVYWNLIAIPGAIESLFFPGARGITRRVRGAVARRVLRDRFRLSERQNRQDEPEARRLARLAVERVGDRRYLVGDSVTMADVTLAAMTAPLTRAAPAVRDDPHVRTLIGWAARILGSESRSGMEPPAARVSGDDAWPPPTPNVERAP
jgi:glutathione S-transferase